MSVCVYVRAMLRLVCALCECLVSALVVFMCVRAFARACTRVNDVLCLCNVRECAHAVGGSTQHVAAFTLLSPNSMECFSFCDCNSLRAQLCHA